MPSSVLSHSLPAAFPPESVCTLCPRRCGARRTETEEAASAECPLSPFSPAPPSTRGGTLYQRDAGFRHGILSGCSPPLYILSKPADQP